MIVEYLRRKMVRTAEEKCSLSHPEVIAISKKLDKYILQAQRCATSSTSKSPTIEASVSLRKDRVVSRNRFVCGMPLRAVRYYPYL